MIWTYQYNSDSSKSKMYKNRWTGVYQSNIRSNKKQWLGMQNSKMENGEWSKQVYNPLR